MSDGVSAVPPLNDGATVGLVDPLKGLPLLGIVIGGTFCGLILLMLIILTFLLLLRRSGCLRRGKSRSRDSKAGNGDLSRMHSLSEIELEKLGTVTNSQQHVDVTDRKERTEDQVPLMLTDLPSPPDAAERGLGESFNRNSWTNRNTSFRLDYDEKIKVVEKLRRPATLQSAPQNDQSRRNTSPTIATQETDSIDDARLSYHTPSPASTSKVAESPRASLPTSTPSSPVIFQPTPITLAFLTTQTKIAPLQLTNLESEPKSPRRNSSRNMSPKREPRPVPDPDLDKITPAESTGENIKTAATPEATADTTPARPKKLKIPPPTLPKPKFRPNTYRQNSSSSIGHYDVPRVHPVLSAKGSNNLNNMSSPTISALVYNMSPSVTSSPAQSPSVPPWERSTPKVAPWDRHPGPTPSRSGRSKFTPEFVQDGESAKRLAYKSMSLQGNQRLNGSSFNSPNTPNMRVTISEDSPSPLYNYQRPGQPKKVATVKPNSSVKHSSYHSFIEHLQTQYGTTAPSQGHVKVIPPTIDSIEDDKAKAIQTDNKQNGYHNTEDTFKPT